MVRHFVRLKLALLASAFRRGWQQGVGLVLGLLVGLPFAVGTALLLATAGRQPWGGDLLVLAFVAIAVVWAVGPVVLFGLDETLDPARLRLLPLTRRQLVAGLLAASAVGIGPLVTLVVLAGAVPGYAPAGPGAVVVVAAVMVQLLLCLLLARALTSALSNRLRSRRGRDVTTTLVAFGGLGFAALAQLPRLLLDGAEDLDPAAFLGDVAAVAAPLPPAWPARAIVAAGEGQLLLGLAWLAASLLVAAALAGWWSASLARAAVTSEASPAGGADRDLYPAPLRRLPASRLGATAAKELRYQWRVPQLRVAWITTGVLSVAMVAAVVIVPALRRPEAVLAPAMLATFQSFVGLNAFGADRGAVWLLVGGGGIQRADLAGKNLAVVVLTAVVFVPAALLLAALTGGWGYLPLAVAAAVSVLGILQAVGNVSSVLAPTPLPDAGQNAFAAASGAGCATALLQGGAMLLTGLLLVPVVAGGIAAFVLQPALLPLVGVLAVLYGAGIWWGGLVLAGSIARTRGPEILEALTP